MKILKMLVLTITAWNFAISVAKAAADTKAPTAPSGLIVNVISGAEIDLTWNNSTDNVGVTDYLIYRSTVVNPTPVMIDTLKTDTSYSDYPNTGLQPETSYTYRVAAKDAAGNISKLSTQSSAVTTFQLPAYSPSCPADLPITVPGCPQLNDIGNLCVDVTDFALLPDGTTIPGATVNDDSDDDTAAIQAHINSLAGTGGRLYFPPGSYSRAVGTMQAGTEVKRQLRLNNRMTLHFADGAILKAKPTSLSGFAVLLGQSVSDVNIIGGEILGERLNHTGPEQNSEWGMGIEFYDAHNMVIQGTTSNENWGDGLYIGATDPIFGGKNSGNINVCKFTARYNRRQGTSITGANGVTIKHSEFSYTGDYKNHPGTLPMAGIDVEPNMGQSVNGVTIEHSLFTYNQGSGIASVGTIPSKPKTPSTGASTYAVNMTGNTIIGNGNPAIYMSVPINNTIDSNIIIGNAGTGVVILEPTYTQQKANNLLNNNNKIINNNIDFNPGTTAPPKYGIEMYQVNNNTVQCNVIKNTDATKSNSIVVQLYNYLNNTITNNAIYYGSLNVFPTSGNITSPNVFDAPLPSTCPGVPASFPQP